MYAHDEFEPDHTSSPTDTMIQDLQLYGYRPAAGEADPRITLDLSRFGAAPLIT